MNFGMITLNQNVKTEQSYMDNDSFVIHIKTEDSYKDIVDDVENWFDTWNFSKDDKGPLPVGWKKKLSAFLKIN